MRDKSSKKGVFNGSDAILALLVIGIVLLLIVPIPPFLLDILLCLSLVFSVMTLLLTLFVEHPLEFSAFPSLLLFLTLYRLGLNIASTRMILTKAEGGAIIETFGAFVTKGNVLVGLILFALVAVINFLVVTKGAGRIAEVAARFTLEALPGKQMAIDAEIQAHHLTRKEAQEARSTLSSQAEFYGAMDGASKFVKGDAIASVVIMVVNICGGLLFGLFIKHLSWTHCFTTFTTLTVGDGLISAIPALLASISAGIMVTSGSKGALGKNLPKQVLAYPKVMGFTALLIFLLGLLPGMPFFIMLIMGGVLATFSWLLKQQERGEQGKASRNGLIERALLVYPLAIELAKDMASKKGPIEEGLKTIRHEIAEEMGVVLPEIEITINSQLPKGRYQIKVKGSKIETFNQDLLVAFKKVALQNAHLLLNRQEVANLVESVKEIDAALVEELIPAKLSLGQVLKVLQNLLKEEIPIKDFVSILEALADRLQEEHSLDLYTLTEHVRGALSRVISDHFFAYKSPIYAITLDPKVEKMISVSISKSNPAAPTALRPQTKEELIKSVQTLLSQKPKAEGCAVILTSGSTRRHLRELLEQKIPNVPVLSYGEMALELQTHSLGVVPSDILSI